MGEIRRVGVIGSGVMGSGIAAHLANAGVQVELLDIVPPDLKDADKAKPSARNGFAEGALKKALKAKPAPFFHPSRARLVRPGNLEDHFDRLKECDLVIEAVVERLDIKQKLFERLEAVIPDHAIVASNTSGLRIENMLEGRSRAFRQRFCVLHFFNPVRYMKLLEVVRGPETGDTVLETVERFGVELLGKGIVHGKDTPNFVGNRIGIHSMMVAVHEMLDAKLAPEDVDLITGRSMAHPKSASFRTADIVGLDTFAHVAANCYESLPDDEERDVFKLPAFLEKMVEKKLLGNKTRKGFYEKTKAGIRTYDPYKEDYRDKAGDPEIRETCKKIEKIGDPKERLRALVGGDGKAAAFAWKALSRSMAYSARRIPEIADGVEAIDDAMRWGYNWELGPFEMWDALGVVETVERMKKDGIALSDGVEKMLKADAKSFYTDDGEVFDLSQGKYVARKIDPRNATLEILRKGDSPVLQNGGAEAWDLGDGVLGVTFKSKANSLDNDVIQMLADATSRAERDFRALLIANEGTHFSVGANLFGIVMAAQNQQWDELTKIIGGLQSTLQQMKYSRIPVVAAPYGMTLGGGLEVCLGCNAVQASAETYAGLVEVGVGLIPGGGGTLNFLWRALENVPEGVSANIYEYVTQVFKNIALAKVATSGVEAQHLGYFRHSDGISFDRERQLTEAKARAIGMAEAGYLPPVPQAYKLPGESGIATLAMMVDTLVAGKHASEHDALIARKLAHVLCGGVSGASREMTEDEMLQLEREAFLSLCGEKKSQERMQHMLMHNKPLRN